MKKADELKCLYTRRIPGCLCAVSPCALCQWPQYFLLRLAPGLGTDGNRQIPGCDLGQGLLGRKQCRETQDKLWHLWAGVTSSAELVCAVVLLLGQAAPMSYSHLSPQNILSQPLEKPRFKAGCSPGKIPVAAEPEFLLISLSRAVPEVYLQEGCHLLWAWSHQPLEWSRQDAHAGLTWTSKHKSAPSASYRIVFQYTGLVWSCVNVTVK